ncbi:MAG: cation transporting ATPase C-terminal domain-containing protein [Nitriliruptoraceae bacterium]
MIPLLPVRILWVNLLTATAPASSMAVDPPPDDVLRRPPRGFEDRVLDTGMWHGTA